MGKTPYADLQTYDYLGTDANENVYNSLNAVSGDIPGSNMNKLDNKLLAHYQEIAGLKSRPTILTISLSLQSSSAEGDYFVSSETLVSEYKVDSIYLLKADNNNTKSAFVNINNLGYIPLKKSNKLGELINIESNDILKNTTYFYQVKNATTTGIYLLMLHEDTKDIRDKSHEHLNKSVLDDITVGKINNWDTAHTHISDSDKHITGLERSNLAEAYEHIQDTAKHVTSSERVLWNTVSKKLSLGGGTLTDFLTLHSNPKTDFQAATKKYVDDYGGKVKTVNGQAPDSKGNINIDVTDKSGVYLLRWE